MFIKTTAYILIFFSIFMFDIKIKLRKKANVLENDSIDLINVVFFPIKKESKLIKEDISFIVWYFLNCVDFEIKSLRIHATVGIEDSIINSLYLKNLSHVVLQNFATYFVKQYYQDIVPQVIVSQVFDKDILNLSYQCIIKTSIANIMYGVIRYINYFKNHKKILKDTNYG